MSSADRPTSVSSCGACSRLTSHVVGSHRHHLAEGPRHQRRQVARHDEARADELEAAFKGTTPGLPSLGARSSALRPKLASHLATGGDSPAVRAELRTIETTLGGLRAEWATIEKTSALPPPGVHPAWVTTKLERLDELRRRDPQRAKIEILKHLDGDLAIVPRPSITGERRAETSGRARSDSLLRDQEAVCL